MERLHQADAEVDPEAWPKPGEEVEAWDVKDWEMVERAVERLRVRPADRARKEKLLRGILGRMANLPGICF